MSSGTDQLHALSGAYALDALDPEEREAFARHLPRCPLCAQEVREFAATAARLGAAVALAPPVAMRAEVLARIDTVRQHPPVRRGMVALRGRTLPLALAACLAGALALGGTALWQREQARESARAVHDLRDLTEVIAAPDARTVTGRSESGARATVVVSAARNRAVFLSSGLPAAPAGRTYQLWFADGGVMRPAGLVPGDGGTLLSGPVGRATAVGVTLEPAGGSARPTSEPLMLMPLAAARGR
ncbi:anti-sigma factor domain-containing protein [Streptomyces sp. NPDC058279]|uniref:anti-sigma factor n=1 Tax=Streptomyces sp. NPDC058279 TaxID=3346418 RepID=UPI0036EB7DD7